MKFLRLLAFPFAVLFGLIVRLRNKLFDLGVLPVREHNDIALIGVGNLSAGGTGKTPHVEYLVRLLRAKYKIGTLSRGYGRKTSGFVLAQENATTLDIGDEPKQFRHRFPSTIPVAVDGNRNRGVKKLREHFSDLEVIVLDDVFQHRRIKPGLNILLTDYAQLYYTDQMLPTGNLREPKGGVKRADIIVVTKTPAMFSPLERKRIIKEINPQPYQKVYFSYIRYGDFFPFGDKPDKRLISKEYYFDRNYSIVLLTGIANSHSLEYFLKDKVKQLIPFRFKDHHEFSPNDLVRLREIFDSIAGENKIILTTEKDAMRLEKPGLKDLISELPLFYIPIEIAFHDKDAEEFDQQILDYVRSNQSHRRLHKGENAV
ncbi:MAG: tetraacyldisaccharide 4''-kinase [Bacteroidetes bacterium]|nr:MAG: tetraacyldisaccharide 4''-kinase [Bacteroidota bacterium]